MHTSNVHASVRKAYNTDIAVKKRCDPLVSLTNGHSSDLYGLTASDVTTDHLPSV